MFIYWLYPEFPSNCYLWLVFPNLLVGLNITHKTSLWIIVVLLNFLKLPVCSYEQQRVIYFELRAIWIYFGADYSIIYVIVVDRPPSTVIGWNSIMSASISINRNPTHCVIQINTKWTYLFLQITESYRFCNWVARTRIRI